MNAPRKLLLLTRPDCHLCDELRHELSEQFAGRYALDEACVDDRPEWRERFGLKIPVLLSGSGAILSVTTFDRARVERYLSAKNP